METIVKDKRDLIQTKNGYFKYTLSGVYSTGAIITAGHACQFRFQLPPLNEMGFSDQYNQCLIQFRSITLASSASTANGKFGENASWFSANGAGTTIAQGIQVVSNIPCRNQQHLGSTAEAVWTGGGSIFSQTLSQKLSNKIEAIESLNGTTVDGLILLGSMDNYLQGTIAGAAAANSVRVNRRNVWSYETDKDIWTGGQLCGIPMGTDVTFQVKSIYNNALLCLSTDRTHLDGTGTAFTCELEIQLLPNPKPNN